MVLYNAQCVSVIGIKKNSMGLWPPFLPCQWDIFDMNAPKSSVKNNVE